MRRLAAAVVAALLLLPTHASAQTRGAVVVTAQQIELHADRGLLLAHGGVGIHVADEDVVATDAMYDLRANRLTATGDVTVKSTGSTQHGVAYVYDFSKSGGAFAANAIVPQLAAVDALAVGQQVEIHPAASITFSNAQARSGTAFQPVASYTYDVPPPRSKDFGYSPVPSAALEWPLLVSTGRNGYAFTRMRYDKYNGGVGTGLEEHYAATDRGYVALAQTLDVDGGRLDLAAYERINDSVSQSLTGSTLLGTHAMRYAITDSTRAGFASLSFAQYNAMRSDDLLLTGNSHPVLRLGSLRPQVDVGHDVHPADRHVAQDFRATPGVHFDTASVHFGRASFSGSFDLGESLYDYGRATLASDAGIWSTVPVNVHLQLTGGVNVSHDAPPFPSTYRTYTAGIAWKASDAFNLVSSLTYADDFGQSFGNGRPQYSAAFDVRFRRRNGTGLEIGAIAPFGAVGNMNRQGVLNLRFIR